jgi:hypothetical protein
VELLGLARLPHTAPFENYLAIPFLSIGTKCMASHSTIRRFLVTGWLRSLSNKLHVFHAQLLDLIINALQRLPVRYDKDSTFNEMISYSLHLCSVISQEVFRLSTQFHCFQAMEHCLDDPPDVALLDLHRELQAGVPTCFLRFRRPADVPRPTGCATAMHHQRVDFDVLMFCCELDRVAIASAALFALLFTSGELFHVNLHFGKIVLGQTRPEICVRPNKWCDFVITSDSKLVVGECGGHGFHFSFARKPQLRQHASATSHRS